MNRLSLLLLLVSFGLVACAPIYEQESGDYFNYDYNQHVTGYHNPYGSPTPMATMQQDGTYVESKPHPYAVTEGDQEKFVDLEHQIQNRQNQVHSKKDGSGDLWVRDTSGAPKLGSSYVPSDDIADDHN
jgi:hypothetical protein